jgi:hypothetical protein
MLARMGLTRAGRATSSRYQFDMIGRIGYNGDASANPISNARMVDTPVWVDHRGAAGFEAGHGWRLTSPVWSGPLLIRAPEKMGEHKPGSQSQEHE